MYNRSRVSFESYERIGLFRDEEVEEQQSGRRSLEFEYQVYEDDWTAYLKDRDMRERMNGPLLRGRIYQRSGHNDATAAHSDQGPTHTINKDSTMSEALPSNNQDLITTVRKRYPKKTHKKKIHLKAQHHQCSLFCSCHGNPINLRRNMLRANYHNKAKAHTQDEVPLAAVNSQTYVAEKQTELQFPCCVLRLCDKCVAKEADRLVAQMREVLYRSRRELPDPAYEFPPRAFVVT